MILINELNNKQNIDSLEDFTVKRESRSDPCQISGLNEEVDNSSNEFNSG